MSTKYCHLNLKSVQTQKGFTQSELLQVILVGGVLPTTITVMAFNLTFCSVLKPTTKNSVVPAAVAQQAFMGAGPQWADFRGGHGLVSPPICEARVDQTILAGIGAVVTEGWEMRWLKAGRSASLRFRRADAADRCIL